MTEDVKFVWAVIAHSKRDYLQTEQLGLFSTRAKAEAWVAQVDMPQRECLEISPAALDFPATDDFWQAGQKPVSPEVRKRWEEIARKSYEEARALRAPDDEAAARITDGVVDEEFGHHKRNDE